MSNTADTQPTKFCVDCKHHYMRSVSTLVINGTSWSYEHACYHGNREKTPVNLVHGGSHPLRSLAQDVREHECHGEWWEERPKPEPEETRYAFFDDKPIGRYTPSLIQRIKRWFG